MKRTEKSKANSRQKSIARRAQPTAGRRAQPAASKRRAWPTAGKASQRTTTETRRSTRRNTAQRKAAASQSRSIQEPIQMFSRATQPWSTRKSSRQLTSGDSESPEDREDHRPQVRDPEHRDADSQVDQLNKQRLLRRAEDLHRNQEGSRTEHYRHSSSQATTGAYDSKRYQERQVFLCFSTLTRPSMSSCKATQKRHHRDSTKTA